MIQTGTVEDKTGFPDELTANLKSFTKLSTFYYSRQINILRFVFCFSCMYDALVAGSRGS